MLYFKNIQNKTKYFRSKYTIFYLEIVFQGNTENIYLLTKMLYSILFANVRSNC